jgi:hypothetical protein
VRRPDVLIVCIDALRAELDPATRDQVRLLGYLQ